MKKKKEWTEEQNQPILMLETMQNCKREDISDAGFQFMLQKDKYAVGFHVSWWLGVSFIPWTMGMTEGLEGEAMSGPPLFKEVPLSAQLSEKALKGDGSLEGVQGENWPQAY